MVSNSKYQHQQLDTLLSELIIVFEKHQAPADLALMALGNMVTNILVNTIPNPDTRDILADSFTQALKEALNSER